ncbi:MAG: type II secretion system protein [Sedimentisphaerales bacterium]|nr:type II secretion system protein [Sedimentisphaerales bacterium]
MNRTISTLCKKAKRGFTLLELMVVSLLMFIVVMLTNQFWTWFTPSVTDIIARAHTLREARMAMRSLADDFGAAVGAAPLGGNRLILCKDGGDFPNGLADWSAPDVLVDYYIVDSSLYRNNVSAGTGFAVADGVTGFTVEQISPTLIRITLDLAVRDFSRQLTFMWSQP